MALTPVRDSPRAAGVVYEELRGRLISGQFRQGERISVEPLKAEFSVSKQPIMEALRLLSADGLVDIIPQVGSVVATYPRREIADFFDMFAGFEGAIAAAAANRRSVDQLDEIDLVSRRLERLLSVPNSHERSVEYLKLNRDFHTTIHRMSGSRIMASSSRRLWDLSDFLINTSGSTDPLSTATGNRHGEHEEIRQALIDGDAERARTEMEHHIRETVRVLERETPAPVASNT
ncbi:MULTISPECIES: GntR family transcriptional regulator [unclassified Brevibacterium]|uniref:GntR family transcriptional regulator n=1 Tax=unclassified Brevibacterium TaxID=2614124 RepID=UPI0010929559|nr:GntR family transcriptional regulator [Brevibacterium sp. S22]TGD32567.1 GntR family transcriptional regulator [Brevibacterium sp. S22]